MPAERLEVTTYFLEMRAGEHRPAPVCPPHTEIVPATMLSAEDYRALYLDVGAPWLWYERSELETEELAKLIERPEVSIFLLKKKGETIGYTELKTSKPVLEEGSPGLDRETQILYFGLVASAIGAGLGRYFLDWTVHHAFSNAADRLWVHTCSLDHERALATYLSAGFVEYKRESGWVRVPQSALKRRLLAQAR